jgi:predicted HicB family RNase H-like nuclease
MDKPKKGDRTMKATMFRIDPELHKALRIAAIEVGVSMNQAVKEAVELWLKEHKRRGVKK